MAEDQSTQTALSWAKQAMSLDRMTRVTRHPWASTYRLESQGRTSFLKQSHGKGDKSRHHLQRLSDAYGTSVPQVIGSAPDQGLYLFADFDATPFETRLSGKDRVLALRAYGDIQRQAAQDDAMKAALPTTDAGTIMARFLDLLNGAIAQRRAPQDQDQDQGNPFRYFSEGSLAGFRTVLDAARPQLLGLMDKTKNAPQTINHCDLRAKNIARRASGELVLFDWDDALCSAPGLSLHAQFSGANRILRALAPEGVWVSQTEAEDRAAMQAYVQSLRRTAPFADTPLTDILRATAVAGVMHYIAGFAPYAIKSRTARQSIKSSVRRRMSDLWSCLETLAQGDAALAKDLIEAFDATKRHDRSDRLRASLPKPVAKPSVKVGPARRTNKDFDIGGLARAKSDSPAIRNAARAFVENGVLVLRDVFPPDLILAAQKQFNSTLEHHQAEVAHGTALRVGDKRYMLTLPLEDTFARADLLAADPVVFVLRQLLSKEMILGSITAVASAPGARNQSVHRDNPPLFIEHSEIRLPSFCVALIIPLVNLNEITGTTRVWPGSHRLTSRDYDSVPHMDPYVDVGSCYLMDSRLFHQGLANQGDAVRPILSLVFQRPWYRDHKNFDAQKTIDFGQTEPQSLDPRLARLVGWAA